MEKCTVFKERVLTRRGLVALGTSVVTAAALAACGSSEIQPESPVTVISHEYDDPDKTISYTLAGKTLIPITHHDPEHFILHLEQCDRQDDGAADENGCLQFAREVSSQSYQDIQDGQTLYFHENPQTHELTFTVGH